MASEFLYILHCAASSMGSTRRATSQLQSNNDIRSTDIILPNQPRRQSQLCLTQTISPPRHIPQTPVLQPSSRILSTSTTHPSPVAYYPDQPGKFTVRPYDHATLHPRQGHGCTSSTAPSLPPGFPCAGYYTGHDWDPMFKRSI